LEERTQGGYDLDDLDGLYANVDTEYKRLPSLHKQVWAFFNDLLNKQDIEQYRQVLMPKYSQDQDGDDYDTRQQVREDFYAALTEFGLCLKIALSSRSFFEDTSFSETDISTYKRDLRWFVNLRKIVRQDAQETVDYSAYEKQIRNLVDKDVTALQIKEPEGVYIVSELGKELPENWNEEKTRNETDIIRTRVKKTIEQDLSNDPYAQKVFSELLKQAIEDVEALFDHPLKQYALFKDFEEQVNQRELPEIPNAFVDNKHAQAYYGIFLTVLEKEQLAGFVEENAEALVQEAFAIDKLVNKAIAENSLNPQSIETEIRKGLLPRLYAVIGLDKAKEIIDEIIRVMRVGISRQ